MTREEAISIIKERICVTEYVESNYVDCLDIEALKIAVKALEQPECKDAVPWEKLERYAEWFCAIVSYPEFVREAKAFCESTIEAMKGGNIEPSITPKQPGWIPISERLPEECINVLATTAWNDVTIAERYNYDKYGDMWFINDGSTNATTDDIAAWMPLPKPWEGKQDV